MNTEMERLKNDLKTDRTMRMELAKIGNSDDEDITKKIREQTSWLQSVGYQVDETEYTTYYLQELNQHILSNTMYKCWAAGLLISLLYKYWSHIEGVIGVLLIAALVIGMPRWLMTVVKLLNYEDKEREEFRRFPVQLLITAVISFLVGCACLIPASYILEHPLS